ncbi:hypothetical protein VN21_15455 [Paraclostridium benzoelyticum]|uniref:Uncharacterized protein n=1 Tax=Paraclostridium benzoelyticum TaxID=1629550 RepID=A0A0M3DC20_9FIRM|nr:hypothetical protein [Paraclostridium benzoelyticum]KKY00215.1 hypothetical protein VN21_15455 [Paraclostridium benzoelyticum]
MKKLNIILFGIATFFIGYFLTILYIPIKDVYLQSIESLRLSILFLSSIISMWGYIIYSKKDN